MTSPAESKQALTAVAAEWVIRLGGGPLRPEERQAFETWRAEDPRHAEAFALAQATWAELADLRDMPGLRGGESGAIKPSTRVHRRTAVSRTRSFALAASVLIVVGLGLAFWIGDPILALTAEHRTAPGEIERIALSDGSVVELGPDSAFSTRLDTAQRRIMLLKGEAYFTVAPTGAAEHRPFVVEAANGTVTALGTAFAVELEADGAEVVVTEHRVRVESGPETRAQTAVVGEGQTVHYDRIHGLGLVHAVDSGQATAWRRGRLVFDRVPLAQVVAELNRYRRDRIVIVNSNLASRRVSGVFETAHLDSALSAITAELGVRTASVPPLITLLY